MSTDIYSQVNFTAGQEVRAEDLTNINGFLAAKLSDQIFGRMLFGRTDAYSNYVHPAATGLALEAETLRFGYVLNPGEAFFTRGTQPNRVYMAPGTIYQKVGSYDGTDPKFLAYTFDGTEFLTIANGSGANPRVDIIQMKLELIETDNVSRVFITTDTYAILAAPTTNFDSTIMARARGAAGNNVRFAMEAGGALAISEVGNDCTITFEDGVTTVADLETFIQANSELIAIQVTGTGANVLNSPDDVLALTNLAGGISGVVTSQNLDIKKKVQCTLSIVTGAAAASPVIPDPDAGYVMIAGIYIPGAHVASSTPGDDKYWYINDAGYTFTEFVTAAPAAEARCCLMDMRMPVGIRPYTVMPQDFQYQPGSGWELVSNQRQLSQNDATPDGTTALYVYCPHKLTGRLVAVTLSIQDDGATYDTTTKIVLAVDTWYPKTNDMSGGWGLAYVNIDITDGISRKTNMLGSEEDLDFETQHYSADFSVGTIGPNSDFHGVPVWTSGLRAPGFNETVNQAGRELLCDQSSFHLMLNFKGVVPEDVRLGPVTFWVAEGI